MKKYFIGMLALVLAIGFSAFTKPAQKTNLTDLVFEFKGTPTNQSHVSDKTKWEFIGELTDVGICDDLNDVKPCRFVVARAQVSEDPTTNEQFATVAGSSSYTLTPASSASQTFYRLISVAKTGYSGDVSNQFVAP